MSGDKEMGSSRDHAPGIGSALERRERPILFSAPMVRALLDGRKTQTRRVAKAFAGRDDLDGILRRYPRQAGCPYGVPGDLLWVRETWKPHSIYAGMKPREVPRTKVFFRADDAYAPSNTPWKPGIHMPRWASRLTLLVADVRVERLQAISDDDAIAEGLYRSKPDDEDRDWFESHREDEGRAPTPEEWAEFEEGVWMVPGVPQRWGMTPAERRRDQWAPDPQFAYRLIWEHIHGPGSWDANPWVWAVSFEVVRPDGGLRAPPANHADNAPGMNPEPESPQP